MANLTPVLGKFGSLNVVVGSDRVLMRPRPGCEGASDASMSATWWARIPVV